MLKAAAIVIIFVLLGGAVVLASARSAEESVRNLEHQWLQNEGNAAVLDSILADDFIHVLPFGFVTKQEQLEFVRKHPRSGRERRRFEELRVRVYGNTAIANGIVDATEAGTAQPKRTMFTDVFVLRQGKWQAVNAQELPLPASTPAK
jgi:hypothetical protein